MRVAPPCAAASGAADGVAVVQSESLADDGAGEVQYCWVILQNEFGVGTQQYGVQLEGKPDGVLACGKLILFQRGGRE